MNFKNTTIAAAILFSLTACGSGGNNTDTTPNKPNIQNEQSQKKVADAQKAEETRKAKEAAAQKAEEARKAKEEAEQKAEEARKAKEAAEQKAEDTSKANEAAQKAEEARKAKEAAEQKAEEARKAKEAAEQKAETDRKAKEAADKAEAERKAKEAAEKAEAERKAKEAADKAKEAADKAEADRKAKEAAGKAEADRKAKEAAEKAEADRQAKEAAEKAEAERKAKETAEKLEQEINQLKGISADVYPEGSIMREDTDHITTPTDEQTQKHFHRHMVYNQKYSVILADYEIEQTYNNNTGSLVYPEFSNSKIETRGLKTEPANLPQEGSATYSGKAFDGTFYHPAQEPATPPTQVDEHLGNLSYTVNFTNKTGSGKITGFGSDVELKEGKISGTGISADAQHDRAPGKYSLDFFGKNAEEIGGKVTLGGDYFGFGGTRGEIQK